MFPACSPSELLDLGYPHESGEGILGQDTWALPTNKWVCGAEVQPQPQFLTGGLECLKRKLPLLGPPPRTPTPELQNR